VALFLYTLVSYKGIFITFKTMSDNHFSKLERMYLRANVNTQLFTTTTCTIQEGKATIGLEVEDKYFHALGAMHGSVYFKLLDDAAFFAVNSVVTDAFVLTTSFNLNLVRPCSSGLIRAEGVLEFQSREHFVAKATLYNSKGKTIAFGTGNFAKSRIKLSEEIGYI